MNFAGDDDFANRVLANQRRLNFVLRPAYDVVVCGAGSSGSVVARRLAENPDVHVLLVEAGGDDDVPEVTDPGSWPANIGGALDWGQLSEPGPDIDGRRLLLSTGKVLGGGSSVNAMSWSRGHQNDWQAFAAESGNPSWSHRSVLDLYRRIEDWHGAPDPLRGVGGEVFVAPASDPHPVALAMLDGARSIGVPIYDNPNGRMMEADTGAAVGDLLIRDGRRASVFRSYTYPYMDRPNLTVLTHAVVRRLVMDGTKATGIEVEHHGDVLRIAATVEVVLSLGAIHTPKVLLHSGIGDAAELRAMGIPVVRHLPGVGRNFQDHTAFDCVWQFRDGAAPPRNNGSEAVVFAQASSGAGQGPDIFLWQAETPLSTPENAAKYDLPESGWTMFSAIAQPRSRGRVCLGGPDPSDPVRVETGALSDPDDLETALACVELSREIANSAPLRQYVQREVMPGPLSDSEMRSYVRRAARTFFHGSGTAKMGRDEMSVVDGELNVYGVQNLRVADGSIMPRITSANTMAPCVVIGECAAEHSKRRHGI